MARAALLGELRGFPFLAGLEAGDLGTVADAITEHREFSPGEVLCEQGQASLDCLLVVAGRAEVRHGTELVNHIGPGETVGEIGAAGYAYRTASVIAETPVRAFVIPARRFRELLDELPAARTALEATMQARLEQLKGS